MPDIPNKVRTNHIVTAINFNKIPFDQVVSPDCCDEKTDLMRVDLDAKAREMKLE